MKFEGLCVVSVNAFNQGSADKNGEMPVFLNVLAGKAPNRVVLSGTVAKNAGFNVGSTYLAQVREGDPDEEYGRQFNWNAVKEASMSEIMEARKTVGAPFIFDASKDTDNIRIGEAEAVPRNAHVE